MKKLLVKIGSVIGLDLLFFVRNGIWVTLNFLVLALGSWILSLLFVHLSDKALLGQYQFLMAVLSMVSVISLPGMSAAALESVVKGNEASLIQAERVRFLSGLVTVPIFLGIGLYTMYFQGDRMLAIAFYCCALVAPIYYALNTWKPFYEGRHLFKEASLRFTVVNTVLYAFLGIGLLCQLNLVELVIIYLLVNTLFFWRFSRTILKKVRNRGERVLDVAFGVHVSIQRFVFGLSTNAPPIAITFLYSADSVAVYYVAYYIINAMASFLGTLASLYIPTIFKGLRLRHKNILIQNVFIGVFLWVLFACMLKYVFLFIYGDAYQESLRLAWALSFTLLLIPLKVYLTSYFMAKKRNWLIISVVAAAHCAALISLYVCKDYGFIASVSVFFYTLEILTTFPLLWLYVRLVFWRNEQKPRILPRNVNAY